MAPIKSPNLSPKKKWQILIKYTRWGKDKNHYFNYSVKTNRRKSLSGKTAISGYKFYKKTYLFKVFSTCVRLVPYISYNFAFNKCPIKEYTWVKNFFGQVRLFTSTEFVRPGFIFYPLNYMLRGNINFPNQYLPLSIIPINSIISNIFNSKNNSIAYSVSSGSSSIKKRALKKTKLTYIELPSGSWRIFPAYVYCLFSPSQNLFKNKIYLGGWGVFMNSKKKINVRGVAMNPVDHPNGGRTKAKQPELSPWGWIAKKTK